MRASRHISFDARFTELPPTSIEEKAARTSAKHFQVSQAVEMKLTAKFLYPRSSMLSVATLPVEAPELELKVPWRRDKEALNGRKKVFFQTKPSIERRFLHAL